MGRKVEEILSDVKKLAKEYYQVTGKPLGVTGEIAEFEAARLLKLKLTPARNAGYDAIETNGTLERRIQIKGRCLVQGSKPGQRLGSIRRTKDWDSVLLVLLDENFEAMEMREAERKDVIDALEVPGSRARNERNL